MLFRKMLLTILTDDPGSIEVEDAYLSRYRQLLKALVDQISGPFDALTSRNAR
jgi:hypothetical protein